MHDVPPPLPAPARDAHKGDAGRVLVFAGSPSMPGAALLVLRAAQRAGAGLVSLAVEDPSVARDFAPRVPEAIYWSWDRSPGELDARVDGARIVGPGIGTGEESVQLVRTLLASDFGGALVVDADGLNVLGERVESLGEHRGTLVLTPHPGEARRLTGRDVPRDGAGRETVARTLAERSGGICVLKGAQTVVAHAERTWVNPTGNPGMATAGSGDVLCGILGAYLAIPVNHDPFDAVCAAVFVHGLAGDLAADAVGERAVIASDLVAQLGAAQCEHDRRARS